MPTYETALQRRKKKEGEFIKPKHLILTDFRVLRPSYKIPPSIPIFNLHETLPKNILRQHFDEVEIPDIDLYNFYDATLSSKINIYLIIFQFRIRKRSRCLSRLIIYESLD